MQTRDDTALAAKNKKKYNSNVTCYKCGKRGHIQPDCRSKPKSGNNYKQDPKSFNSTRAHEATDDFAFAETDIALPTLTGESWLADSACTSHISQNKNLFQNYTPTPGHKVSGFGNVDGLGRGTVKLESTVNGDTHIITLQDVVHAPDAPHNLILISRADDAGSISGWQGTLPIARGNCNRRRP